MWHWIRNLIISCVWIWIPILLCDEGSLFIMKPADLWSLSPLSWWWSAEVKLTADWLHCSLKFLSYYLSSTLGFLFSHGSDFSSGGTMTTFLFATQKHGKMNRQRAECLYSVKSKTSLKFFKGHILCISPCLFNINMHPCCVSRPPNSEKTPSCLFSPAPSFSKWVCKRVSGPVMVQAQGWIDIGCLWPDYKLEAVRFSMFYGVLCCLTFSLAGYPVKCSYRLERCWTNVVILRDSQDKLCEH